MSGTLSAALLKRLLKTYVRSGALRVIDPGGHALEVGHMSPMGDGTAPTLTLRFNSWAIVRKLALNPALHLPEGYMTGELEIEVPEERREPDPERALRVIGASANNLKGIDVEFPLGL
ncbi:MAG: hypothetical protein ACFB13_10675, partial [Kiloniellaceae bacterium]